jgi:hypothetical protein
VSNFTARDCESYGSGAAWDFYTQTGSVNLDNNLFQYTPLAAYASGAFGAFNNLYRGDSGDEFYVYAYSGSAVTNRDNAFDATSVSIAGTNGHNAYLNGASVWTTVQTNDITTNLTWVAGPLGNFYQATNSPLINHGSRSAALASLYHYTVTTNEVPETTNSAVAIGYHYVALGTNGLPLDANGDGIPDYLEDSNGDGVYGAGDLANWLGSANSDSNGIIALQVYTPLR